MESGDVTTASTPPAPPPPPPLVSSAVKIGFNSVTRSLERAAARRMPACLVKDGRNPPRSDEPAAAMAVVFVVRSSDDSLYAHLPALCATASAPRSKQTATRIVSLDASAEARLARTTQLPRVGIVGVPEDCPNAAALIEYAQHHVECVEIPWLTEALNGQYQPLKIEVTVPSPAKPAKAEKTVN